MRTYKRLKIEGGCYFFTVVLVQRNGNNLLIEQVDSLRESFKHVQNNHPFTMNAIVIMPDHLHCIWQLPEGDDNFSTRWRLIKAHFSQSIKKVKRSIKVVREKESEGFGNAVFGNMLFVMVLIMQTMLTTFITIL